MQQPKQATESYLVQQPAGNDLVSNNLVTTHTMQNSCKTAGSGLVMQHLQTLFFFYPGSEAQIL